MKYFVAVDIRHDQKIRVPELEKRAKKLGGVAEGVSGGTPGHPDWEGFSFPTPTALGRFIGTAISRGFENLRPTVRSGTH